MGRQIYVNLPVKDLERTKAFFAGLGFSFNPQFTDDKAACMIIADDIHAMLLVDEFFRTFTKKPVADATKTTEVLVALSCDSRAEVDRLVARALASGGAAVREPKDHGFMYEHAFQDPDGHIWELLYMEPQAAGQG